MNSGTVSCVLVGEIDRKIDSVNVAYRTHRCLWVTCYQDLIVAPLKNWVACRLSSCSLAVRLVACASCTLLSTSSKFIMKFTGKRTLITGAGAGIGRDIALEMSRLGAEVYALSRTKSRLESLQKEDPKIHIVCVDISDWDATRKAVEEITPIHLLVNNAAMFKVETFLETTKESIDEMFAVNVKGPINIAQVVINDLLAREMTGTIVNVSSDSGLSGFADSFGYSLTKAALDNFTKCVVAELSCKGIRINSVNPSLVLTESGKLWADHNVSRAQEFKNRIPLRRFLEVSDVTNAVVFLLSDESAMINGHTLPVDGGLLSCQTFQAEVDEK